MGKIDSAWKQMRRNTIRAPLGRLRLEYARHTCSINVVNARSANEAALIGGSDVCSFPGDTGLREAASLSTTEHYLSDRKSLPSGQNGGFRL